MGHGIDEGASRSFHPQRGTAADGTPRRNGPPASVISRVLAHVARNNMSARLALVALLVASASAARQPDDAGCKWSWKAGGCTPSDKCHLKFAPTLGSLGPCVLRDTAPKGGAAAKPAKAADPKPAAKADAPPPAAEEPPPAETAAADAEPAEAHSEL